MAEGYSKNATIHYVSTLQDIQARLGVDGKKGFFSKKIAGLNGQEMETLRELTMYLPAILDGKEYRPIDLRQSALILQQIQTRHSSRLLPEDKQVLKDVVLILAGIEHPTDAPEPD
jgi:hypothetical protein